MQPQIKALRPAFIVNTFKGTLWNNGEQWNVGPIDNNKVNFLVRGGNFLLLPRMPLFLGHKSCLVVTLHEKLI